MSATATLTGMAQQLCNVEGCNKPVKSRGWCAAHYERWRTTGDVRVERPVGKLPRRGCRVCGTPVPRTHNVYCSRACAAADAENIENAGRFTAEHATLRVPVGTVRIRVRPDNENDRRAWVKVAEPNVWKARAIAVWEAANGPVPRGKVIHHRDRDSLNDVLDNLQALTRAEHLAEHRNDRR